MLQKTRILRVNLRRERLQQRSRESPQNSGLGRPENLSGKLQISNTKKPTDGGACLKEKNTSLHGRYTRLADPQGNQSSGQRRKTGMKKYVLNAETGRRLAASAKIHEASKEHARTLHTNRTTAVLTKTLVVKNVSHPPAQGWQKRTVSPRACAASAP